MKSRRCVFPYDGENRAQIMNAPMQTIESSMMIATCDRPLERISEGSLVSRGSCMGYMGHVPVYSGIDGRIVSITGRKLDFWKTVYDIKLNRKSPLIVEIPDRHGTAQISETINRYVHEAVGITL